MKSNGESNGHSGESRKEELLKILEELKCSNRTELLDGLHETKRRLSFEILDELLESCKSGICPHIDPSDHYYLVDISAGGYIQERAYYYYIDSIGIDTTNRYYDAKQRIMNVFECGCEPKLDLSIFDKDSKLLKERQDCADGARNRKAFWRYLARKQCGTTSRSANDDYCDACGIVESIRNPEKESFEALRGDNLDIINGVDLFRYCLFRSAQLIPKRKGNAKKRTKNIPH